MATKTIDQLPSSSPLTGTEVLPIVQGNETLKTTVQEIGSFNRPYKVFTALLTQSGGDDLQNQQSGLLTAGVTYYIDDNASFPDFTNVGAPNNNVGTYFVATGTTPNSWGEATLAYNTGAPIVTVLENTLGNVWFEYRNNIASDELFIENKTVCFMQLTTDVSAPDATLYSITTSNSQSSLSLNWYDVVNDIDGTPPTNTPIEIRVYN
jgi:hypothetical protein